jgi:demethylmenaquinone methyltransferase/2-methoxy-6-polyprenyl-1,4-benzoquinol methylase
MGKYYPDSKVEVTGAEARHYDILMNLVTFGMYSGFIKKVIKDMEIQADDFILDLGCGTGRNACLMLQYLSENGKITGYDISPEMIEQFKKNCLKYPNMELKEKRIDTDLGANEEADKAFISFVLHGFPQDVRLKVIENVYKSLKPGGEFIILDYNEFKLKDMPFYLRIPFTAAECKYAFDYIEKDWEKILSDKGFGDFRETTYFGKYVRLLKARKI